MKRIIAGLTIIAALGFAALHHTPPSGEAVAKNQRNAPAAPRDLGPVPQGTCTRAVSDLWPSGVGDGLTYGTCQAMGYEAFAYEFGDMSFADAKRAMKAWQSANPGAPRRPGYTPPKGYMAQASEPLRIVRMAKLGFAWFAEDQHGNMHAPSPNQEACAEVVARSSGARFVSTGAMQRAMYAGRC